MPRINYQNHEMVHVFIAYIVYRFLSTGGSKITVKKHSRRDGTQTRSRSSDPERDVDAEPRVMCSDSDDPDHDVDRFPSCQYIYRIAHCRAVTNPHVVMGKMDSRKVRTIILGMWHNVMIIQGPEKHG